MISMTIFNSIYDNKTNKRMTFESFDEFEQLLYKLATKKSYNKKSASLISPATYKVDTLRRNDNVIDWGGWAALDVDDIQTKDFRGILAERFNGLKYICYSTASSRIDNPKFRVVLPTNNRVPKEKIKKFWYALNTLAGSIGDAQVKDMSRMYYVPADYRLHKDSSNFIFTSAGDNIPVDELIAKYPMPVSKTSILEDLPESVRNDIIEHRKNNLTNTNVNWSSFRDCPFWPKRLEAEYRTISNGGWYYQMYKILVAIAGRALWMKYPITVQEMADLCYEFDMDTGGWYKDRPILQEADRALTYAYQNFSS